MKINIGGSPYVFVPDCVVAAGLDGAVGLPCDALVHILTSRTVAHESFQA